VTFLFFYFVALLAKDFQSLAGEEVAIEKVQYVILTFLHWIPPSAASGLVVSD
jgi:hypothetical protein